MALEVADVVEDCDKEGAWPGPCAGTVLLELVVGTANEDRGLPAIPVLENKISVSVAAALISVSLTISVSPLKLVRV